MMQSFAWIFSIYTGLKMAWDRQRWQFIWRLCLLPGLLVLFCLPLQANGESEEELEDGLYARINTNRGIIQVSLDYENTELAVANFVGLAEGQIPNSFRPTGVGYFDGLEFYNVARRYAVFSGDPDGNGQGGPGYTLPRSGSKKDMEAGALLMAGLPSESSGSRFFITLQPDSFLSGKFMHFGQVVSGMKVLGKIDRGDRIKSVSILRLGADAERFIVTAEYFQALYEQERIKEVESFRKVDQNLYELILGLGDKRQKTLSGIYYLIEREGKGAQPVMGSRVSLSYTGTLVDGTVFDSSVKRGEIFEFVFGEHAIIPGWTEMVGDMRVGEKRRAIIPPAMAYGEREFGPVQSNSWLVFDIEFLDMGE